MTAWLLPVLAGFCTGILSAWGVGGGTLLLLLMTLFFGVAQADDGDLPVVVLGDPDDETNVIGALCSGAQARITSYTQTDYVQISLGSLVGYVKKSQIRVLTTPNEPLSDRIPQRATTKTDVDIRFKPEVKAAVVETVSSGARVYMFGKFGDWAYVLAGDSPSLDVTATTGDRAGFVPLAALNAPASTTHLTASVLKDKVNVRSEADNQSGAIIGKARTGDRLLVTDYGIAVNPLRPDLVKCLDDAGIPHVSIESLKEKAYSIVGRPDAVQFEDKVVAVLEARDGTILDVVRQIKPYTFED